jgi:hypothetical protein
VALAGRRQKLWAFGSAVEELGRREDAHLAAVVASDFASQLVGDVGTVEPARAQPLIECVRFVLDRLPGTG